MRVDPSASIEDAEDDSAGLAVFDQVPKHDFEVVVRQEVAGGVDGSLLSGGA